MIIVTILCAELLPFAKAIGLSGSKIFAKAIASYGSECWVLADKKRIKSFELWCYIRLLRRSWTEKITNDEALNRINITDSLLNILLSRTLAFLRHVLRRDSLGSILLMGMVMRIGQRKSRRPGIEMKSKKLVGCL